MASAETSFRMQKLLLVDRDLWPPVGDGRCRSATWFRYKTSGTIQPDLLLDKFDSVKQSD